MTVKAQSPVPCGPYAVNAAFNGKKKDVDAVAREMKLNGGFYTTVGEMRRILTVKLGYEPAYKRAGPTYNRVEFLDGAKQAIAFVQWGKRDRHWVYLKQTANGIRVHCSVKGNFTAGRHSRYKRSHIRSYFVLA